jgi:hypothetical protein
MRNVFELTKREQRVVIVIVTLLVAIAFAKHAWQSKGRPTPEKPSIPAATPLTHHESEDSADDSGD